MIVHLVANTFSYPAIAGPAFCISLALMYSMIASRYSYLVSLITVAIGTLAFSLITQLLGEIAGSWATTRLTMSLYLATILVVTRAITRTHAIGMKCHLWPLATAACSSGIWLFISNLDSSTLVTFLGYGYDNAAHLMQGRIIMGSGGSVLISGGSELGPTFLQDYSQVGGSLIASAASLMGITASNAAGLMKILTVISLAIPIISIAAVITGFVARPHRRSELVLVTATVLVIFGTGYLSRIWFSGYLGSNLGTMCAVLIAVYIATTNSKNIAGVSLLVIIMIHAYPIFAIIGAVLLMSTFFRNAKTRRLVPDSAIRQFPFWTATSVGLFGLLLFLPYHATSRSYGASQFLIDGGIEYFPASFFILLLAIFLVPLMVLLFTKQTSLILSPILYLLAAFGLAAYSYSQVHRLAYYPTKFVITFILMVVGSIIATMSQVEIRWMRNSLCTILLCLATTYLLLQPKSEVFVGAYMGEAPTVLESAREAKLEVVDSKNVVELSKISRASAIPILYISNAHESELNTRWINTLSLNWNDQSWTDWMRLGNLISQGKYVDLGEKEVGSDVMIVTDDVDVYRQIKINYLGIVCIRRLSLTCNRS